MVFFTEPGYVEGEVAAGNCQLSPKPLKNSTVLVSGERTICLGDERVRSKYMRDRSVDCGALWPLEKNVQNRENNQ